MLGCSVRAAALHRSILPDSAGQTPQINGGGEYEGNSLPGILLLVYAIFDSRPTTMSFFQWPCKALFTRGITIEDVLLRLNRSSVCVDIPNMSIMLAH